MQFSFKPIGFIHTEMEREKIPRHWSHSDAEGLIEIDEKYIKGIQDIRSILLSFFYIKNSYRS